MAKDLRNTQQKICEQLCVCVNACKFRSVQSLHMNHANACCISIAMCLLIEASCVCLFVYVCGFPWLYLRDMSVAGDAAIMFIWARITSRPSAGTRTHTYTHSYTHSIFVTSASCTEKLFYCDGNEYKGYNGCIMFLLLYATCESIFTFFTKGGFLFHHLQMCFYVKISYFVFIIQCKIKWCLVSALDLRGEFREYLSNLQLGWRTCLRVLFSS